MISTPDRHKAVELIDEARAAGARLRPACRVLGITARTYQRWTMDGSVRADRRPEAVRPMPSHALSDEDRQAIVAVCNQPEHASMPPGQIVPKLADEGRYLASESTFYRVLSAEDQQHHRGRAKPPRVSRPPATHRADKPNAVWCWDITWLPADIRGRFFFLYLIMDLFSRKIVGWEVHENESAVHSSDLVQRTVWKEGCTEKTLVLHGDNGSPIKGQTVQVMLGRLGITASFSRPRVSDDNAFVESLFPVVVKIDVALSMLRQPAFSAALPSPGSARRFRPVTSFGYLRSSAVDAVLAPPDRRRVDWPGSRYPARCDAGAA